MSRRFFAILLTLIFALPCSALELKSLANSYIVGVLNIEGPFYAVEFKVEADGKTVKFRDGNLDFVRPEGDCSGQTQLQENLMKVDLKCISMGSFTMEIDFTGVTLDQLTKEEGAKVQARSQFTQNQWLPFKIIKRSQPYFPKK